MATINPKKQQATIATIANRELRLSTLDEQGRDRLDFPENIHVTAIKQALSAAYTAGAVETEIYPQGTAQLIGAILDDIARIWDREGFGSEEAESEPLKGRLEMARTMMKNLQGIERERIAAAKRKGGNR